MLVLLTRGFRIRTGEISVILPKNNASPTFGASLCARRYEPVSLREPLHAEMSV